MKTILHCSSFLLLFVLLAALPLLADDPTSQYVSLSPIPCTLPPSSSALVVQFEVWDSATGGLQVSSETHNVDINGSSTITNDTGFSDLLLGRPGGLNAGNFPAGSSRYLDVTWGGLSVLTARIPLVSPESHTFTTIDFPGAVDTRASGINPRGDIVGGYRRADGVVHGFLLSGGNFTTIDFPGATFTETNGINPSGDIVGDYSIAAPFACFFRQVLCHGFLLSGGEFTSIDFPGASSTIAFGINPGGDIVGRYDIAGVTHGFLLSRGEFTSIDFPGASLTQARTINPRDDIVGRYDVAGVRHGFLLSRGELTSIDFPGAVNTRALGINPRGDIVGGYSHSDGVAHGFLLSGGSFTTIDFPGGGFTDTVAFDINPSGDIVGEYMGAGMLHGFLMSR